MNPSKSTSIKVSKEFLELVKKNKKNISYENYFMKLIENQPTIEDQQALKAIRLQKLPKVNINNIRWHDDIEAQKVRTYIKKANITFEDLCRSAILEKINRESNLLSNIDEFQNMSDDELKASSKHGTASVLILRAIDRVKNYNENSDSPLCITKSLVSKITGCNMMSINRVFNKYRKSIDLYNGEKNLTPNDNRRGGSFNILEELNKYESNS